MRPLRIKKEEWKEKQQERKMKKKLATTQRDSRTEGSASIR